MLQFRSDKEKNKWRALQNRADIPLNKLIQGNVNASDIAKLSSVLGSLSKLAQEVFDAAVKSAEEQAKSVVKAGNIKIEDGISAFEKELNTALSIQFPKLIQDIKEILSLEIYEHTDELDRSIGIKFTDLKSFLPPKDLPTTDDLLAANDLLVERLEDARFWEARETSIANRIIEGLQNFVVKNRSENQSGAYSEKYPTIADRGMSLLTGPEKETNVIDVESHFLPAAIAAPLLTAGETTSTVTHEDLPQRLLRMMQEFIGVTLPEKLNVLKDMVSPRGAMSSTTNTPSLEDVDKKETRKADNWWKSFSRWIGSEHDTTKSKAKKVKGNNWLEALKLGLMSLLLTPTLWTSVAQNIEELFTWDNIKKWTSEAVTEVVKDAKDVGNWIANKIANFNLPQMETWIAGVGDYLADKIADFLGIHHEKRMPPAPTSLPLNTPDTLDAGESFVSPAKGTTKSYEPSFNKPSKSISELSEMASSPQISSIDSNTIQGNSNFQNNVYLSRGLTNRTFTVSGRTYSTSANPVSYAPGFSVPNIAPSYSVGGETYSPKGSSGSFNFSPPGFQSSVDDQLTLMNSSFLSV